MSLTSVTSQGPGAIRSPLPNRRTCGDLGSTRFISTTTPSPRKVENPILGSVIEADEKTCLEAGTLKRVTSTKQATADSPDTTTRNSKAQPFSCGYCFVCFIIP